MIFLLISFLLYTFAKLFIINSIYLILFNSSFVYKENQNYDGLCLIIIFFIARIEIMYLVH